MTPRSPGQITKYTIGSVREIVSISFPLMLSLASIAIMVFWDRFFLSRLSQAAFSAASEGAMFFIIFEYSLLSLAATAEVYVGRFFGAKRDSEVAQPCWAMIWTSLFSSLLVLPIAKYAGSWIFATSCYPELAERFFRVLTYFVPLFGINMALASFWVGRGKTFFITAVTIFINCLNIALDPLLIFGLWGFPALEIEGAALATGISQLVQTGIYFIAFFRRQNREQFGTSAWKLNWKILISCLQLGWPLMVTLTIQNFAWSVIARMMSIAGETMVLVWGVVHTAFLLCSFIGDAVGRAVTAIAANLIGSGSQTSIFIVMKSGLKLHIVTFSCILLFFLLMSEPIMMFLLPNYNALSPGIQQVLFMALCWNIGITFFEALLYLWGGVLFAMEDTLFPGVTSSMLIWILAVLPAGYQMMQGASGDVVIASTIWYYIAASMLYLWRCRCHMKRLCYT